MKDFLRNINVRFSLIVILAFLLGWQLGHKEVEVKWANFRPSVNVVNRDVPKNINLDFKLFWDTWDLLSQNYFDKSALDPQKLYYGAISGMVAAVGDPYTVFLPPEQQKSTKEELGGAFEGVGIQLGFDESSNDGIGSGDKRLMVIAPLDGTPAKNAGIKPKDLIVKIEDKDTTGMSLPEAVKLIRGPKGSKIHLTIAREGETDTKEYELVRDTIVVKSVELSFKNTGEQSSSKKNIAIIKLSRFGDKTKQEWIDAVSEIVSKKPDGVILDVRNNPGGFLDGAVFVASEFLENGQTVVMQENNQGKKDPFKVTREGNLKNIPLIVLINKGSASASEIVAGALQDLKRAKLVGEKSFGKGTIQEAEDLAQNTGIHITVAKWLTPNGRWVNSTTGFDPDVKIEMDKEDTSKDPQLDKALELLE